MESGARGRAWQGDLEGVGACEAPTGPACQFDIIISELRQLGAPFLGRCRHDASYMLI